MSENICPHNWVDDGDNLAVACTVCGASEPLDLGMSAEELELFVAEFALDMEGLKGPV